MSNKMNDQHNNTLKIDDNAKARYHRIEKLKDRTVIAKTIQNAFEKIQTIFNVEDLTEKELDMCWYRTTKGIMLNCFSSRSKELSDRFKALENMTWRQAKK